MDEREFHNGAGSKQRAHLLTPLTDEELGYPLPPITFVLAGFMKCGTTSIAMTLHSHPDCRHSIPKETHFFTHNYDRGLDWFRGTMAGYAGEPVIGESSMSYTTAPWTADVVQRIYDHNPDTKLIFALRDPVKRLISGWQMARSRQGSSAHHAAMSSFEDYVLRTEPRHPEAPPWDEPTLDFAPPVPAGTTRVELNIRSTSARSGFTASDFVTRTLPVSCLKTGRRTHERGSPTLRVPWP